jgi:hypothetical protein
VPKLEQPRFWIVAGPNGSGKSTLYDSTDIEGFGRSVWIINPDLLSAQISEQEKLPLLRANGVALDRIATWLRASIQAHQTVGVETALSKPKYRNVVGLAKKFGFEIRLCDAEKCRSQCGTRPAAGTQWRSRGRRKQDQGKARALVQAASVVSDQCGSRPYI